MKRRTIRVALALTFVLVVHTPASSADGQITLGVPVAVPAAWLDPAEATGILIPFMVYYALHDALVKPLPGNAMAPSLAESWSVSPDGLTYEFVLRPGARFHNGEPVTADDVKFSLERYRGVSAKIFKDRIQQVQAVDPQHLRIRLKDAWPDFLTFYATPATGAAWVVPRKYVEKVGDDGFKKAPIGAGPYRFVSFTPGVELVLEAYEEYWRKKPSVKRLVLKLKPLQFFGEQWCLFTEQWDPKSVWADRRVRLAFNLAIDREAMNQSISLGFSKMTGSIIPRDYDFSWPAPPYAHDPKKAHQLLAEAGYPRGFDAGDFWTDTGFAEPTEAIASSLTAVGIRTRIRAVERAAYFTQLREKKLRPLVYVASGAYGNAATRIDSFVAASGAFTYGSYADIEGLIREQAAERDRKRREATLHKIQQLMYERVMFAPIWNVASLQAYGPRVAEPGLGLIHNYLFSAPYEDMRLK